MRKSIKVSIMVFMVLLLIAGCARYERKVVPFKMPSAYPNATEVAGAVIAARAFDDPDEANSTFGFDISGAGILPVQVTFDNKGPHPLEIVPGNTYLLDAEENMWPIIDSGLAYDRISKKTELGEVVPEATKSGLLAGTAGAIIGAAIGIVTGHNVGDAAMKGAAMGAAAGLTVGGTKGLDSSETGRQIGEDIRNRSLEQRPIPAYDIAHGFIFFPGEAKGAKELRLSIIERDTGVRHLLVLPF